MGQFINVLKTSDIQLMTEFLEEVWHMERVEESGFLFQYGGQFFIRLEEKQTDEKTPKEAADACFHYSVKNKSELQQVQNAAAFFYYRSLQKEVQFPFFKNESSDQVNIFDPDGRVWAITCLNM